MDASGTLETLGAASSLDSWLPRERLIFWLLAGLSLGVYLLAPLLLLGMACLMFVAFQIYPSRR